MNLNESKEQHPNVGLVKQEVEESENLVFALVEHEVRANTSKTVSMEDILESPSSNTTFKAEISRNWQLELKSEIPDRDCDVESDANVFIKQELLHEELDIKSEDETIQDTYLDDKDNLGNKLSTPTRITMKVKPLSGHKSNLKKHLKTNTKKKPFKCHICDFCCAQNSHLKAHLRSHTREQPFKCNICNFCSSQNSRLKRHLSIHTGEKPFTCNICHYSFTRNSSLKMHLRIHTGVKPFKCSICDYRSSNRSGLRSHLLTHSGEKLFKCNICEYCCAHSGDLKKHLRIHSGEKPFKCNICNHCFAQKGQLKRHLKTHTGEKPFNCNRSFQNP